MEEKPKFYSCRLAVHHDSGRVRWCIGQEKNWRTKIKLLVFLPLILLSLVVVIVLVSRALIASKKLPVSEIYLNQFENGSNYFKETYNNTKHNRFKRDDESSYKNIKLATYENDSFAKIIGKVSAIGSKYFLRIKKQIQLNESNYNVDILKKAINELREKFNIINNTLNINNKKSNSNNRPFLWDNQKNSSEIRQLQSELMRKYMNDKVDPCDNFYEFSCGNWKNYYSIPPDKFAYDTFELVRDNLDYALKDLLSANDENELVNKSIIDWNFLTDDNDTSDATLKAKHFYKSCMQEDIITQRGVKPLKKLLNELNNWPIIFPNWNESTFDLEKMLAELRLLNNDLLISQWVGPDMTNSKEYIIHIDQTSLGLPSRDYYLEESNIKYIKAYKLFILTVATLLGANNENAQQDVNDIIDFETQLAQIKASPEERRNISEMYLRIDIKTLTTYFHEFDWKRYFQVLLGKNMDEKTTVVCYCSNYLYKLLNLIEITNPRVLQNYLIWRFVKHRVSNLDARFMDAIQKFYHVLSGREKQPPRWQFCVSQVNTYMGMPLGSLFVKKYFNKISRTDTVEMTEKLAEAFLETLLENNWLDNKTKNYARMKINEIDLKIGFPDAILNDTRLTEEYSAVKIHPNYFFENTLSILKYLTRLEQSKIGTAVNRTSSWRTPPTVVNAYYSRNKNQITFPAAILQPPFYHRYFPKALNFGGIGVVIGHEITHGFDDKGRLFDYHGNLHLWWSKAAITQFYEKSFCLINQYNQYIVPEIKMPLDGLLTQGENIADNGGLKQSFRAYEKWLKNNPEADETLPNLNFTGKQLFFINFAQAWCGQQRIEIAKSRLKTSVHPPGIFRVIGALSNSEEFSRVFNCPENSPMNPENKCTIW